MATVLIRLAAAAAVAVTTQSMAQVVATAESGTADAGIASRPIANVAANDTINGAGATLGASGNASVAQSGTWPTGVALTPSTGAVSTRITVPAGSYSVVYQLCDKSTPVNCTTATDTVTVVTSSINAVPESGSADAGVASRPIVNVAANDTVNGAAAMLGASGNATVAQSGNWPAGIALNPLTGAVSTKLSVPAGTYSIPYQLCDHNVPANCATATDTVTVIASAINAVPDSGSANVGTNSTPIANVAANDSVNGAPAVLGASGNATISQAGTWPSGISLSTSTGAVNVAATVAAGTYSVAYQLCDLNLPAQCASATDTVTIVAPAVAVVPDSGTANVGVASTPIQDVAANDSVAGSPATLGASGNATVSQVGTWPSGIALSTSTGAISTTASVVPGSYSVTYQLCDLNSHCGTATDSVTVLASIVPMPLSGSVIVGTNATAITNIIVNDNVNLVKASVGTSGNATIAAVGTWPGGIALNTTTAAITVSSGVPVGSYDVQHQLCDKNTPANCATSYDVVFVLSPPSEVQASPAVYGDIEFDFGRDGVDCPACNDGQGNNRINWTDHSGNLWVNHLDRNSGLLTPSSGKETLVDPNSFFWTYWGNGAEWTFYTPPGSSTIASALVYSRWAPGTSMTAANSGAAFATASNGVWTPNWFPGAFGPGTSGSALPEGTMCETDPVPLAAWNTLDTTPKVYVEPLSTAPGTTPVLQNFGGNSNQIGKRWTACTHMMTFQGVTSWSANAPMQIFFYDTDTQIVKQLTTSATSKQRALMFKAPEVLGTTTPYLISMMNTATVIQILQVTGFDSSGAPIVQQYNTIRSPDPNNQYMFNPNLFVHCNPTCHTYVFFGISQVVDAQFGGSLPTGIGIASVDPNYPFFKVLVPSNTLPLSQRQDPEYFITNNGPYIYYVDALVSSGNQGYQTEGLYFVDTGLGPISGPCVGSSAEAGLAGPVGTCQ